MIIQIIFLTLLFIFTEINLRLNMDMKNKPNIPVEYLWEDTNKVLDKYYKNLNLLFKVELIIIVLAVINITQVIYTQTDKIDMLTSSFVVFILSCTVVITSFITLHLTLSSKKVFKSKKINARNFYESNYLHFDENYDLYTKDFKNIFDRLDNAIAITFKDFANEFLITSKAYNITKEDIIFIEKLLLGNITKKDRDVLKEIMSRYMSYGHEQLDKNTSNKEVIEKINQ